MENARSSLRLAERVKKKHRYSLSDYFHIGIWTFVIAFGKPELHTGNPLHERVDLGKDTVFSRLGASLSPAAYAYNNVATAVGSFTEKRSSCVSVACYRRLGTVTNTPHACRHISFSVFATVFCIGVSNSS